MEKVLEELKKLNESRMKEYPLMEVSPLGLGLSSRSKRMV
jgi:hypothetical protein